MNSSRWSKACPLACAVTIGSRASRGQVGLLAAMSRTSSSDPGRAMSLASYDRRPRGRRPPASPAERQLVRDIARFITDRRFDEQSWLVAMALVSREFPDVKLDSALMGYVFRSVLAPRRLLQ